jgi:elongation factor G
MHELNNVAERDFYGQGFYEALQKGNLCGNRVVGCRFVLKDGSYHVVDSSELAFRLCTMAAFRENYEAMRPVILEPIMTVEVVAPSEFQSTYHNQVSRYRILADFEMFLGNVIGGLTSRRGSIIDSEVRDDEFTVTAEVALNDMFGYSSQLRGATQGKGEFSMEYKVCPDVKPLRRVELTSANRLICLCYLSTRESSRKRIARNAYRRRKSRALNSLA